MPIANKPTQQMPLPNQQAARPTLTKEMLNALTSPEEKKQQLGEHLYARVAVHDGVLAGRIVGMILDAYTEDQILANLNDENLLKTSISQATQTIKDHEAQTAGGAAGAQ